MRVIIRVLSLVLLFLLASCASQTPESAAGELYAGTYAYSEIPVAGEITAGIVMEPPIPIRPEDALDDRTCAEVKPVGAVTEEAGLEVFDEPIAEYASSHSDGAMLAVGEDDRFLYRVARRYEYVAHPPFTFDLLFIVSGSLQQEGEAIRLVPEGATVSCSSLSNGTEAEAILAQNVMYTAYGLELNERMLAGEALSLDEFLGSGAFAQLLSTPVFVELDTETQCFTLSHPLLGD